MEALLSQCASHSVGPTNQLFGLLIQTLLAAQCSISPANKWPKDYGPTAIKKGLEDYDFIIIGAGSAGSVLANRLSENPHWKILLLEAGGDPPIESEIPLVFFTLQNTNVSWNHYADPSPTGSKGTKIGNYWPHGKVLGGSSSINAMLYMRGNRQDFDNWAALGNPSWDWDSVLEYFKKSQDNRSPDIAADAKHHSTGGFLKIEKFPITPAAEILSNAFHELGYNRIVDINADKYIGFVQAQGTLDHGTRCSTAKAFLIPAKDRVNLHVIKHAHVTSLTFNADKSVKHVNFVIGSKKLTAKARKEFILSAGALGSPQILLNSGVGPKEQLAKFNIKSIAHLPVGENLQDHIMTPYLMTIKNPLTDAFSYESLIDDYYNFIMHKTGKLSGLGGMGLVGYVNTLNNSNYPDVQFLGANFKRNDPNILLMFSLFGYQDKILASIKTANENYEMAIIFTVLLNPKSTGSVELKNTNPFDAPKITSNYLKESDDLETILRGFKISRNLLNTSAFKNDGFEVFQPNIPGCANEIFDTDNYWRCYIRHLSSTMYHPSGTTKMGSSKDDSSVVDSQLRVKGGVKGLRVIDAGIMPNIVSGNTNAATIMIGEKGADFIKSDWMKLNKDEL